MNVKGICLRTINHKDKDKLLIVATLQQGIIVINARGVRTQKAKLKAGCCPLVFGDFLVIKSKGGLILSGIEIEESFNNCWTNADKNLSAMLILEFLEKSVIKGEEITHEILLTLKALNAINYTAVYPLAIAVWYLLRMLKYIGVDIASQEMPQDIKKSMLLILDAELEDIETMELYQSTIASVLLYINLIIKSTLSINLLIIKEINKFYKQ